MSSEMVTYRESHSSLGYGRRYDANYARGYYAAIYRGVECPLMRELFAQFGSDQRSLLDFASGTGRITHLATPFFGRVVGVDVSEPMLENARRRVPDATFLRQDITSQPLGEKFDVVTAFRFFLNAEDELRRAALVAIAGSLKQDGLLICNVHMNKHSIMGLVYRALGKITGKTVHKTMSFEEFQVLLEEAGFGVERVVWYGVLPRPGRLFARILDVVVGPVESFFRRTGLSGRFAHTFLVVARCHNQRI